MKDWEYNVLLVLSVCCLVLAVWIIGAGRGNEKLQSRLQAQQVDIERGNVSRQLGSRIVQDMMLVSSTNSGIKIILEKYGFVPPMDIASKPLKNDKPVVMPSKPRSSKSGARK